MGSIFYDDSGKDFNQFAEDHLFVPLGIHEYLWTKYPDGTVEADGGLALRSRDLAKFGQLFLNHGEWGDQQFPS